MKLNITLASTAVTFEFDTPRDRDTFWKGMEKSGFIAQGAAERLGTRGINITTAKIRSPYAWPFEAIPGTPNGNVAVKQVEKPTDIPNAAPTGTLLTSGLANPASEPIPAIPIPEIVEVPTAVAPVAAIVPPVTTVTTQSEDPEPTGHKNSRAYREWKARHK
jgi:hypothetical protein